MFTAHKKAAIYTPNIHNDFMYHVLIFLTKRKDSTLDHVVGWYKCHLKILILELFPFVKSKSYFHMALGYILWFQFHLLHIPSRRRAPRFDPCSSSYVHRHMWHYTPAIDPTHAIHNSL